MKFVYWKHVECVRVLCLVENRQLLGELEGIDLLLQQLSVSDDYLHTVSVCHECINSS